MRKSAILFLAGMSAFSGAYAVKLCMKLSWAVNNLWADASYVKKWAIGDGCGNVVRPDTGDPVQNCASVFYSGIGISSSTAAEAGQTADSITAINVDAGSGVFCWCKRLYPNESNWVSFGENKNSGCAHLCAAYALTTPILTQKLLGL
jgi:hypothetical protein